MAERYGGPPVADNLEGCKRGTGILTHVRLALLWLNAPVVVASIVAAAVPVDPMFLILAAILCLWLTVAAVALSLLLTRSPAARWAGVMLIGVWGATVVMVSVGDARGTAIGVALTALAVGLAMLTRPWQSDASGEPFRRVGQVAAAGLAAIAVVWSAAVWSWPLKPVFAYCYRSQAEAVAARWRKGEPLPASARVGLLRAKSVSLERGFLAIEMADEAYLARCSEAAAEKNFNVWSAASATGGWTYVWED